MVQTTGLKIKQLGHTFVAEIEGLDFSSPITKDTFQQIKSAIDKYGVLVIRKSNLDDASHVAFGKQFGELDSAAPHNINGYMSRLVK
jgi:alpha-ketoglutarate-dependent 2,4-dichlorophenoxyacetate dioxygenase